MTRQSSTLPFADQLDWAFSILGCPTLDLTQSSELAARFGVRHIELRALEDRLDLPTYFQEKFGSPEALAKELKNLDIAVPVLDTSFNLLKNTKEDQLALLAFLPWAEAIGCQWLRVFDGGEYDPNLSREFLERFQETVGWWRSERARVGNHCDIIVETHNSLCYTSSIIQVQNALDEPVKILWDSHHTWFWSLEDPVETWDLLKQWIVHIHVKDSIRDAKESGKFHYVLPGQGDFPLHKLLAKLAHDAPGQSVSFESERKWIPSIPPLEEILKALSKLQNS